jgi:hypothetical protein
MKLHALWLWALAKRAGILVALFFDCLGNFLLRQSFHKTMSGEAWHQRNHKWFGWCHRFIDALPIIGYPGHCQHAAEREERFGSVWAAWMDKTRRVWSQRPQP